MTRVPAVILCALVGLAGCNSGTSPLDSQVTLVESSQIALAELAEDAAVAETEAAEAPADVRKPSGEFNTETYDHVVDNPFFKTSQQPLSTFSIDVDTASYANVRRFIQQGQWPPPGAVRIEEMVNYFPYDYAPPTDDAPFAAHVEVAACPWKPGHRLVRVALRGKEIPQEEREDVNLVFLLDVSGSMSDANKLPLLKTAMRMLVENLEPRDHVAIVVYAGASGLVLPPTPCANRETILAALEQLQAGGSTNGGEGIELAYAEALRHFNPEGVNVPAQ